MGKRRLAPLKAARTILTGLKQVKIGRGQVGAWNALILLGKYIPVGIIAALRYELRHIVALLP